MREELPHSTAVIIDEVLEEEGFMKIYSTIYLERESQKGIMIGHKGETLKKIGTAARKELEDFLGIKIFIKLFVKVKRKWRQNDKILSTLDLK